MKPLAADCRSVSVVVGLQPEIQRSEESGDESPPARALLVAQGMTCPDGGRLLGDAPRTVEYWVSNFEKDGLAGYRKGSVRAVGGE